MLSYWAERNKSKEFSKKLNNLFQEAVQLISLYPDIGKPTSKPNIRLKIVRDYYIVYEFENELISILTIWDSRQNPDKLRKVINPEK
ncbi:type II toxin-antitoxin system RelE/ParE family toxin [Galbibacter sp. BG1]|uniref:type II toxin-antitoxin system RelE/ParE family toxin n=1 Tax=Galbibacter sp. BG1 TaxID=1170699 RepID=UPI002105913D|nr:type II toxin-antitoxin system RelE/ParE family toxin [Galbibacter sp. BG1]